MTFRRFEPSHYTSRDRDEDENARERRFIGQYNRFIGTGFKPIYSFVQKRFRGRKVRQELRKLLPLRSSVHVLKYNPYSNSYGKYKRKRPPPVFRQPLNYTQPYRGITRYPEVRKMDKGFTRLAAVFRRRKTVKFRPLVHRLIPNPYNRRSARYNMKVSHKIANPYNKRTGLRYRNIYNPYTKKKSKHVCGSALCGCS